MGFFSNLVDKITGKYYYRRYKRQRDDAMRTINSEYGLGFHYTEFERHARKMADIKYAGSLYKASSIMVVVRLSAIVVSAVLTAAAIGAAIASGGALLPVSVAVIAVATSLAGFYASEVLAQEIIKEKAQTASTKMKAQSVKNIADIKQQSKQAKAQLTHTIIYAKYEPYANGSLYNAGKAGDLNTFKASMPFNPNNAMLGTLPKKDDTKIDDMIWGRDHNELPGNQAYMQQAIQSSIPVESKIRQDYHQANEQIQKRLVNKSARFNEGWSKLTAEGFGQDFGNPQAELQRLYREKHKIYTQTETTKLKVNKELQRIDTYKDGRMNMEFYRSKWITTEQQTRMNKRQGMGLNDFTSWETYYKEFDTDKWSIPQIFEICMFFQSLKAESFFDLEFETFQMREGTYYRRNINGEPFALVTNFKFKELSKKQDLSFDEVDLLNKFIAFYFSSNSYFNHKLLSAPISTNGGLNQIAYISIDDVFFHEEVFGVITYKNPSNLDGNDIAEMNAFFKTNFWHWKLNNALDGIDTSQDLYNCIQAVWDKYQPDNKN